MLIIDMRSFSYFSHFPMIKPHQFSSALALLAASVIFSSCGKNNTDSSDSSSTGDSASQQAHAALHPVMAPTTVTYNQDIRPILSENCYFCHGPDPETREEGLRLDLFEAATENRDGITAIVPGNRRASEVWKRINDPEDPMPPVDSHKSLNPEQIEIIGRWIDQGAEYQAHWAYEKPERPATPTVSEPDWPANPIDHFILARLDARDINPSPQAERRALLRRVTFDLTGLPPTSEQTRAFLADDSPDAYTDYVDSLLADSAYGEHLATWWLDLVRYADTIGIHSDNPRSVWPYRDWVIRSFNDNLPFDQFTTMQLAGDLMQPEPTQDMLIASAYNRLAPQTEEGGAQPKEYETIYNADRVANYSDVWLGSSLACAQCHDHKFDPFTTKDFYSMAAFFSDINQAIVSHEKGYGKYKSPFIFLPENDEQAEKIKAVEKNYRAMLESYPEALRVEERMSSRNPLPDWPGGEKPAFADDFRDILKQRRELAVTTPIIVVSRQRDIPRTVRILNRGNWQDESGEIVQPATPGFLNGPTSTESKRLSRLDLAKWTTSPDNPLTARVIANRLWGRYLGSPLSANTVDLGSQGAMPTHPGLLDWLAIELRENNWDLKHLIRLIVTSKTYQQSANARSELADIDPDNTNLYARQSARRLPAEAIRDHALAVSGLLDERIGGPSVFPYQPQGHWKPLNFPTRKWPTSSGNDLYRRTLYTWFQRTFPHPMMVTFDVPSRESCTGRRINSITPLQSLASLNAPIFVESARVLAATLLQQQDTDSARLDDLFMLALSRSPRDREIEILSKLLERQRTHFRATPDDAKKLIATGEAPVAESLDPVELAAWTSLCRVVLNLHETITRH